MPVLWLIWAIVSVRRWSEKAVKTARPRASDVMKLGSPVSASISSAIVGACGG